MPVECVGRADPPPHTHTHQSRPEEDTHRGGGSREDFEFEIILVYRVETLSQKMGSGDEKKTGEAKGLLGLGRTRSLLT